MTQAIAPDDHCITHGAEFFFQIARGGRGRYGTIYDDQGILRWQYGVQRNSAGRHRGNPFNKPDFIINGPEQGKSLVIRRTSLIPSVFQMRAGDNTVGRLALRSLLGLKYTIEIDGVDTWTLRLPLFTTRFWGASSDGFPSLWVVVGPSKMEWSVLLKPGTENDALVGALAFVHNQWWNYG